MNIKIIKAEATHAERIYELLGYISRVHQMGRPDIFKGDEPKYSLPQVKLLISSSTDIIRVAVDECGFVVGYMICQIVSVAYHPHLQDRKALYIDDLCVDGAYHSEGIGTALFDEAKRIGHDEGCDIIDLNVWSFNKTAISFYERLGMTESRRHMELKL